MLSDDDMLTSATLSSLAAPHPYNAHSRAKACNLARRHAAPTFSEQWAQRRSRQQHHRLPHPYQQQQRQQQYALAHQPRQAAPPAPPLLCSIFSRTSSPQPSMQSSRSASRCRLGAMVRSPRSKSRVTSRCELRMLPIRRSSSSLRRMRERPCLRVWAGRCSTSEYAQQPDQAILVAHLPLPPSFARAEPTHTSTRPNGLPPAPSH